MLVVAKVGTSSLTDVAGRINVASIAKITAEIAVARTAGHRVVLVSSGAIAAGLAPLGFADARPNDLATLQAVAAVGQHRLMAQWDHHFGVHDIVPGQVLLDPYDFSMARSQYLHARQTLDRLLELGVVPIINENDAVADDEIRFGDNDQLAALVAHMVGADLLVLLTDTAGLFTSDPRHDDGASLIEEIVLVDAAIEAAAGGTGSRRGSGGMASKLAAAKIAAWSGVRAIIAASARPDVLIDAVNGVAGVGTSFRPKDRRLGARKLWIAFAVGAEGTVVVDAGARRALIERGTSLLPAGVVSVKGAFAAGAAVEVATPDGEVFAKGLVGHDSATIEAWAGRRTDELDLAAGVGATVIHRDDLVVLP